MSIIGSNILAGASGQAGYNLNNSLRFRSSASGYLNRTLSTPTNNKIWTWSAWIKLGKISTFGGLFGALNGTDRMYIAYGSSAKWQIYGTNAGTDYVEALSTGLYRDPSAWYHLVIAVDTTQATASNRLKMYVNGTQETVSFTTNMTLNANTSINKAIATVIGESSVGSDPFDGYMTEVNFVDGQQLTPSSFGSTNSTTGVWQPAQYTGTYGTNGFYLKFADASAATAAAIGKDSSGNGNNWTPNNISVTAGVTYDAMTDVPTLTSATVANYCVLNSLNKSTNVTVSNANLTSTSAVTNAGISGTIYIPSTGKYYWEATCTTKTSYMIVGIANATWDKTYVGSATGSYGYANDAFKYPSNVSYGTSYTSADIIGVAFDADTGTLTFYKNNTSQGAAYTGLTDSYTPAISGQASDVWNMNFGQRPFSYTPPSGYVALNTYNLPTPTILQGNKYMDATLYTGTNAILTVTNAGGFYPDFTWLRIRNQAYGHSLFDSVRGATKSLQSQSTNAETTQGAGTGINSFNSNGFTLGTDVTTNGSTNYNTGTYVAWQWLANAGSTVSNTSGTITSTVSVSTTAGFSVFTYTGNATANATIGHGLGVAPKMFIVKPRSTTGEFLTYHVSTGKDGFMQLQDTAAFASSANYWGTTGPTSTTIQINGGGGVNNSGTTYVVWCWAEIAGYSKAFSYTGNGSTDGSFVFLGFLPRFVMIKRTDTTGDWYIWDTARNTYDVITNTLLANSSAAETSATSIDALSNGFKLRNTTAGFNASGGTYIGMAWATNPFKNSNAF